MMKEIKESMGGMSGSGAIAGSRTDLRTSERDWRKGSNRNWRLETPGNNSISDADKARKEKVAQILAAKKKKKSGFRSFLSKIFEGNKYTATILENSQYDLSDIVSRLKSAENQDTVTDKRDVVTYGVEDDNNNIMKISVKSDQAEDFEKVLAQQLADIEDEKRTTPDGVENDTSLAELLFKLKDHFDIVDVEFPTIPTDAVYNADKITLGFDDSNAVSPGPNQNPPENPGQMGGMEQDNIDGSMDNAGPDQMGNSPGGEMPQGGDDLTLPADDQGLEGGDVENSEDFVEEPEPETFQSLFKGLLSMMSSQAEAEKAKAEAEKAKAEALTAEYSAKMANNELANQEELMRMQSEMDEQKKKEKDAKQMADLAKFRVNQSKSSAAMPKFESFISKDNDIIKEFTTDELGSESSIRKELSMARTKYQITNSDDNAAKQFKRIALSSLITELNAKLRRVRAATVYQQSQKNIKQDNNNNQQNNNNQNGQNNNNQNANQQNNQNMNNNNQQGNNNANI